MKPVQKRIRNNCPRDILDVLPLIVNEACPPETRDKITNLFDAYPGCKEELERLKTLGRAIKEEAASIPVPSDVLLKNIMEHLKTKEENEKDLSPIRERFRSLLARFAEWLSPPSVRFVTALAILIILFQWTILLHQSKKISIYRTLSGPAALLPGRISLNIIFNPKARFKTIQAFLVKYHGQIIKGPGASGVYVVSFPALKDPEKLVKALKKRGDIICFAEVKN
jgi:hypothetical protein